MFADDFATRFDCFGVSNDGLKLALRLIENSFDEMH